jgi:hypothetical protein
MRVKDTLNVTGKGTVFVVSLEKEALPVAPFFFRWFDHEDFSRRAKCVMVETMWALTAPPTLKSGSVGLVISGAFPEDIQKGTELHVE